MEELEEQHSQQLEGIAAPLEKQGERTPTDGASARAGAHSLEGRDRALRSAMAEESREGKNLARLDREVANFARGRFDELFHAPEADDA